MARDLPSWARPNFKRTGVARRERRENDPGRAGVAIERHRSDYRPNKEHVISEQVTAERPAHKELFPTADAAQAAKPEGGKQRVFEVKAAASLGFT